MLHIQFLRVPLIGAPCGLCLHVSAILPSRTARFRPEHRQQKKKCGWLSLFIPIITTLGIRTQSLILRMGHRAPSSKNRIKKCGLTWMRLRLTLFRHTKTSSTLFRTSRLSGWEDSILPICSNNSRPMKATF